MHKQAWSQCSLATINFLFGCDDTVLIKGFSLYGAEASQEPANKFKLAALIIDFDSWAMGFKEYSYSGKKYNFLLIPKIIYRYDIPILFVRWAGLFNRQNVTLKWLLLWTAG